MTVKCGHIMWNLGKKLGSLLYAMIRDEVDYLLFLFLQRRCQRIWVHCSTVLLLCSVKSLTSRVVIQLRTMFWLHVVHTNLCGPALSVSTAVHWLVGHFYTVLLVDCRYTVENPFLQCPQLMAKETPWRCVYGSGFAPCELAYLSHCLCQERGWARVAPLRMN